MNRTPTEDHPAAAPERTSGFHRRPTVPRGRFDVPRSQKEPEAPEQIAGEIQEKVTRTPATVVPSSHPYVVVTVPLLQDLNIPLKHAVFIAQTFIGSLILLDRKITHKEDNHDKIKATMKSMIGCMLRYYPQMKERDQLVKHLLASTDYTRSLANEFLAYYEGPLL